MNSNTSKSDYTRFAYTEQNLDDKSRPRFLMALEYGLTASEALHLLYTYEDLDEGVFIEYLKITLSMAKRNGPYM
jgi:hypothetical protein